MSIKVCRGGAVLLGCLLVVARLCWFLIGLSGFSGGISCVTLGPLGFLNVSLRLPLFLFLGFCLFLMVVACFSSFALRFDGCCKVSVGVWGCLWV